MSAVENTDQERRITFLLYDCWDELAGETSLPALKNMRKQDIEPFKKNLVLLDLRENENQPLLQVVGQNLQDDLDEDLTGKPQSAIPRRSMLSRVTDHYLEVLANRVPIAFEAEFVNRDSEKALYRGILLPFSDDNKKINFILGGVRWILEKDVQLDENEPSIEELMRTITEGKESAHIDPEQIYAEDEENKTTGETNKQSQKSRYANDDDIETLENSEEDNLSRNTETDILNDELTSSEKQSFDEDAIRKDSFDAENNEEELILSHEEEFETDELVLTEEDEANDLIESIKEEEPISEVGFADESIDDIMEASGDNHEPNEEIIAESFKEDVELNKDTEISEEGQNFDHEIITEENEIKEDFFASYEEDLTTDELILATDDEIDVSDDNKDIQEQDQPLSATGTTDQVSLNIEDPSASFADEMKLALSEDISYETTSLENSPLPETINESGALTDPLDDNNDILELSEAYILDDENEPEEELSFEERSADELQMDDNIDFDQPHEASSSDEVIPTDDIAQNKNLTLKEFLPEQDGPEDGFNSEELVLEEIDLAPDEFGEEETTSTTSSATEAVDSNETGEDDFTLAELMEQVIKSQNLRNEEATPSAQNVKADEFINEPSNNTVTAYNDGNKTLSENEIKLEEPIKPIEEKAEILAEEKPKERKSLIERAAESALQKELAALTSQSDETKIVAESDISDISDITVEDNIKQENELFAAPVAGSITVDTQFNQQDGDPDIDENDEKSLVELQATLKHILGYIKKEDANHNRSRDSLYNILAAIYGFYYICEESPEAYNQLASEYNLKVQQRAPFTPVLKMCLGNDYDKTRLTEYAATLTLARHLEIEEEDFPEFIKNFPGGIKGCVKELREIRKQGTLNTSAPRKNQAINEAKETLSHLSPIGSFKLKKIIVGDNDQDFCLLLAKRNGHTIDILKILDDKYTKLDPIIKRAAFIKGNGNVGK